MVPSLGPVRIVKHLLIPDYRPRPLRHILRRTRSICTSFPVLRLEIRSNIASQILTGSSDRTIRLFNPAKAPPGPPRLTTDRKTTPPGLVQSYSAHGYEVLDIAVTDDNARFASVGGDKQVFLWDVAGGKTLRRWAGHGGRVNAVAFGGEGASVVVSGEFGLDPTRILEHAHSMSYLLENLQHITLWRRDLRHIERIYEG